MTSRAARLNSGPLGGTTRMDRNELLGVCDLYLKKLEGYRAQTTEHRSEIPTDGAKAEISEFLRRFAGPKSSFFEKAEGVSGFPRTQFDALYWIVKTFREFVEAGLHAAVTSARGAQMDVV